MDIRKFGYLGFLGFFRFLGFQPGHGSASSLFML